MHPTNILLMEDDHIIAEDIKAALKSHGYGVVTGYPEIFTDGEHFPGNLDAIIADSHIALVLMDINLNSQVDGVELVKHIHTISDIPVIYISGISKPETVRRARETEPYAYLLKPFNSAQLHSQVEMTLQLHQSRKKQKIEHDDRTGVWLLSVTSSGIRTSFSWLKKFGFGENYVQTERDFLNIIHPDDLVRVETALRIMKRRLVVQRDFEYRIVNRLGEARWLLSRIIDAKRKPGSEFHYTILTVDITNQKTREAGLHYDSMHDILTGLLNRKAFMHELDKLLKETEGKHRDFALIFSDLDKFKEVNDEYGHDTGDEMLRKVAGRFQQALKKKDILARFGGDEFAFIIQDLKKPGDIHYIAQRIINSLKIPLEIGTLSLNASVSLGVSMPGTFSGSAQSLLKEADKAMYEAKKDKKIRYRIFKHMPERIVRPDAASIPRIQLRRRPG